MREQISDTLTLNECLATMRRLGVAPEAYIDGYRSAFLDEPYDFGRGLAYARGRSAGLDALRRGAHGAETVIGIIERDGAA